MIVRDIAKAIAEYLDFAIDFVANPRQRVSRYSPDPPVGAAHVSDELTLFALIGVVIALAIAAIAKAVGVRPDPASPLFGVLGFPAPTDPQVLPLVALLLVLIAGLVFDALSRIAVWVAKGGPSYLRVPWLQNLAFGGSVKHSLNATLAFAAIFVPFGAFVLALLMGTTAGNPGMLGLVVAAPVVVVGLVYFPAALSGTHREAPVIQIFVAFYLGLYLVGQSAIYWRSLMDMIGR